MSCKSRGPSGRTLAIVSGPVTVTVMAVLFVAVLVIFGVLLFMSPGHPKPFLDVMPASRWQVASQRRSRSTSAVFEQGMFIKGKNDTQSRAALPSRRHARLLPHRALLHGTRRGVHRCLVGAARFGALVQRRCPPESVNAEQLVSDARGADRLPARALRREQDLPDGSFRRDIHWNTGGRACAGLRTTPTWPWPRCRTSSSPSGWRTTTCSSDSGSRGTPGCCGASKRRRSVTRVPLAGRVPQGAGRRHAPVGHRHDERHEVDRLRAARGDRSLCREYTLGEKVGLWRGKISPAAASGTRSSPPT